MNLISALLLAAGKGKRMKRVKQLLPLGERSMVEVSLKNLQSSRVDEIIIVLGFAADRILPLVKGKEKVRPVINPCFREGMSTSIHHGLKAIHPQAKGIIIALADQPFITSEIVNLLIERFSEGGKGIVVPVYQGRRGHPVIMDRERYERELLGLRGDVGGKEIVERHPEDVLAIEVSSSGIVVDIDDWEEYEKIQGRVR